MRSLLWTFLFIGSVLFSKGQCEDGQISLTMNVYTDSWGYETYWELVPGNNECGNQTIAWGSNIEAVGCDGGAQYNAYGTDTSYPPNTVVNVPSICLVDGEYYTLYFVDDYGDGGLYFELFEDANFSGFHAGTGSGNSLTFQAGNSPFATNDSPCGAMQIVPGINTAIDLSNNNCYAQVSEIEPPQGNCLVLGVWCQDEVSRTAWAKFVVPDDGAYEISTVHNGTTINSQVAVWIGDDCADMSSFIYVSGKDDFIGDSNIAFCDSNAPPCVDRASAAYLNVLETYPSCCQAGWDNACQILYNSMSESCNGVAQTCEYLLEGLDTYGDGWIGCYLIVTIDGVASEFTITEGNYASWTLPVISGTDISIQFVAGNWPEEVYVTLKNADGVPLMYVQAATVDPMLYDGVVNCNGVEWFNPQASRCYTNCLMAGTMCYIQIDGYDNQTGQIVLSVKPYNPEATTNEILSNVLCPIGVGAQPEGMILPNIIGWGLNYSTLWSGPNNFTSDAYFLENIGPGEYTYSANDLCGNSINETFIVEGPEPFFFNHTATPTCLENTEGSVSFQAFGGTEPYEFVWIYPDTSAHSGVVQNNLQVGTYYVYLVDANGCDIVMPAVVEALPQTQFDLGEDFLVCSNFGIMLEGPVNQQYVWSTGATSQTLIVSDNDFAIGNHEISLTVSNEFGCEFSDSISIEVQECVNTDEVTSAQILMFPNPTSSQIYISNIPPTFYGVQLRSITGELVFEQKFTNQVNLIVDVQSLAVGCYIMILLSDDNNYQQQINVIR